MYIFLLINETEIIKVIHVSSKFYGPGLIKWPQGMMPLTPPWWPRSPALVDSLYWVPAHSSTTTSKYHKDTAGDDAAESGPDPPDCWTSEQRLSLLLNTAVYNILKLNEILQMLYMYYCYCNRIANCNVSEKNI